MVEFFSFSPFRLTVQINAMSGIATQRNSLCIIRSSSHSVSSLSIDKNNPNSDAVLVCLLKLKQLLSAFLKF